MFLSFAPLVCSTIHCRLPSPSTMTMPVTLCPPEDIATYLSRSKSRNV